MEITLDGDPEEQAISAEPVGRPRIITDIDVGSRHSDNIDVYAQHVRRGANAFMLGTHMPSQSSQSKYSVAIQYYRVSDSDWQRAESLEKTDRVFRGFFGWP